MEAQSGEARWINPIIEQNAANQQMQQQAQQQAPDQQMSPDDQSKYEQVRQAMILIQQMKEKGVENRSMQEQSKYKQAVQIVAKNPEIAKSMSSGAQQQQPTQ